ncbi:KRAB [Mytilus edulis]|uniref:KRAB n=1 Tax=Mytilus edulis TaxID=6550 RepID=A0A8S3T6K9_MYTED|nr:KRAB [Mytilus edulis]
MSMEVCYSQSQTHFNITSHVSELDTDCKLIWTKITPTGNKTTYLGGYYRPPSDKGESLEHLSTSLNRICNISSANIMLSGDFNLGNIDWSNLSVIPSKPDPSLHQHLLDILQDHNLTQKLYFRDHRYRKIMPSTKASVSSNKAKTWKIKIVAAKQKLAMKTRKTAIKNSMEVKEKSKKRKLAVKKPRSPKSKVNTDGEAQVKSVMSADDKMVLETQNSNAKPERKKTTKKNVCNKLFLCEHCATYFKRSYDLDMHIKRIHSSKECNKCQKVFSNFRLLTEHLKFVHGVEPVKFYTKHCTECDRLFDSNTELSEHMSTHTGENLHTCKDCNKKISTKSAFKFHLKICQNAESLKNFECEICQKKFYFNSDLLRHNLTHSGARPHKCEFCGMKFKLRGALVEHVKSLHENSKYPCETCGKIFSAMRNLKRHTVTHKSDFEANKPLCPEKQCKQRLGYHLTPTEEISGDLIIDMDTLIETGKNNKKQKKNNKRKRKSPQKFDIIDWEFKSEAYSENGDSGMIKQKEKLVEVVMETENEISDSDGEDKTVNSIPVHTVHIDGCKSVTVEGLETSSEDTISVSKSNGDNIPDGNLGNTSLDKAEDSNHANTNKTHKYQRSYAARCMGMNTNSSVNQKGYIKNDIYEQLMKSCQDKLKSGEVFPFTDPSVDYEKDEDIDVDLVESVPLSDSMMETDSLVFVAEKVDSSENAFPVI